jgi:hypothetical protein
MTTYDLPWVLPYVRQPLRGKDNLTFDEFADGVYELLERVETPTVEKPSPFAGYSGRTYNEAGIHADIRIAVTEAFYYCQQNRLSPPPTHGTYFTHGKCQITQRGKQWASGVEPLPEDYSRYMKQFPATTDDVVRQYISEALHTYINGHYFASAVMVGAASEKCIYMLADSLVPALNDAAKKARLQRRIDDRRLENLFKGVEQIVIQGHAAGIIPFSVMGGTTRHLLSIFDHIRLQRNDAIHPMNFVVSADSVRSALAAFPMAFVHVEALREWCNASLSTL